MADIELNTALLTNMEIQECLGKRGGTAVYRVKSTKSDQLYILKHISVPESQRQVEALIFTGAAADNDAAQAYYQQVVADYQTELEQLEALANSPNLDSFRSYEIRPKEEGVGFDVFLLAEYRITLERYLAENEITQSSAVNLAVDLCSALADLRAAGLIHRDVKPSNIYLSSQGHFMLGDMGIASVEDLKYCSMPESMLSPYSAPELFNLMANVNETVDLYAVGLILYRIYNGNHAPLEDEKTSAKSADKLRITGQDLPAPMFADYEMAEILHKACAFQPEDRYQTPEEMKQAFVDYMLRNQVGDAPITPPIVADEAPVSPDATEEEVEPVQFANTEEMDETFKQSFSPDNEMLNALIESVHRDLESGHFTEDEPEAEEAPKAQISQPKKSKKRKKAARWLPTVLAVLLVLALAAGAVWFFFLRTSTLTINGIEALDRTVDSLTVQVTTEEAAGSFEVVCTDAYGSMLRQTYTGEPNTFTGLASGAQYTISVEGLDRETISGVSSILTSTKATTDLISFTVSRETVSEAELTFIVDGAEPEEWAVSYGPTGQAPKTKVFTGHSVVLTGLEPDTEYTVTLLDPDEIHLTGDNVLTCHTLPSVEIERIDCEISDATATLTLVYSPEPDPNAPITCDMVVTGTDGTNFSQTITGNTVELKDLKGGVTYTILFTSDSMVKAYQTDVTPNALSIQTLTAEVNETGGVDVQWSCEAASDEIQWLVTYSMEGSDGSAAAEQAEGNSITLTGLIPDTSYTIEIQEASGKEVSGETTVTVKIPAAEDFTDYRFPKAYVSTWIRPQQENWTISNLKTTATSFTKEQSIAFACESLSRLKDSDDVVAILLVVRNSDGVAVDHYSGTEVWNNMWTNDKYVGELLRTPQEAGSYTLEIYFNGQRVQTTTPIAFNITE